MEKKYREQIAEHTRELEKWQRWFHLLGYGKLMALVLLGWTLYRLYAGGVSPAGLAAAACLLGVTVAAWLYHIRVHNRVDLHKGLIAINEQYLQRIGGGWHRFPVTGEAFAGIDHAYGRDLDIVGGHSLYQLLCVAHTWHGRRAFAADLLETDADPGTIRRRQQAVSELAGKTAFASLFEYHTGGIKADEAVVEMIDSLQDPATVIRSRLLCALLLWVPPAVTALAVLAFGLGIRGLYLPAVILLAGQGLFWVLGLPRTNRYLSGAASFPYLFRHYAAALDLLGGEEMEAPLLREIQSALVTGERSAAKAIRALDTLVSNIHLRNSGILYFLCNVFLLWDYRCAVALSRWKQAYGGLCESWFLALGEFESLLSLAVLPNVCEDCATPVIVEDRPLVSAKALGHPLLPNGTRVRNDFAMERGMVIISGSNMSGKTTFLRTVGINLILARAGGSVCAGEMSCALFAVMSSMRIADDLSGGISTFYAELARIARIIEGARSRDDVFFLIDEIFRGTNSEDRLFGAAAVIRELATRSTMGIITTHDLSLCDLAGEADNIRNYSFSERYEGEEMLFDYRMREGKSQSTNARFLMRKVGILPREDAFPVDK